MTLVMVTRPEPQGDRLCQLIRESGGHAIHFPTLVIEPLHDQPVLEPLYDWIIFVSPSAAYYAVNLLPFPLPKVAAVGLSTAEVLIQHGITVTAYPEEDWSTEGLLKLPEFQHIVGQKIRIIKGEEGRETLAHTLQSRGAQVSLQSVYRRILPEIDPAPIRLLLRAHKIDIIVCTSTEGIRNLLQLLGEESKSFLLNVPLLVISERLKDYAGELGFQVIKLAKNASHQSILASLKKDELL